MTTEILDRNNTLEKLKSKLPPLISKYCGNDLKDQAVAFTENEYVKTVNATKRKYERACGKIEVAAKTVADYDWPSLIKNHKLGDLNVAQLNLYLTGVVGMSRKDVYRKGYKKEDKIDDIISHYYVNRANITTVPKSSKISCVPTSHEGIGLNVLPWGGGGGVPVCMMGIKFS